VDHLYAFVAIGTAVLRQRCGLWYCMYCTEYSPGTTIQTFWKSPRTWLEPSGCRLHEQFRCWTFSTGAGTAPMTLAVFFVILFIFWLCQLWWYDLFEWWTHCQLTDLFLPTFEALGNVEKSMWISVTARTGWGRLHKMVGPALLAKLLIRASCPLKLSDKKKSCL
jgi:hypothetical protein